MRVLGIETSCDETACAIVQEGRTILSNVVSSQVDLHREFGGVVPELACRRHIDLMMPVLYQALDEGKTSLEEIDLIAVSYGPGLVGALLIGVNTAKALAFALNKPFIGVNHVEAHLYGALMSHPTPLSFPCLGVVLSGGHTTLLLMEEVGRYTLIGQTVDDAVGEAFDKVAQMIGYPYPGGPHIERLALLGNPYRYPFKGGQVKGRGLDFSFSGLKTAVLYAIKGQQAAENYPLSAEIIHDIAASFQRAAFDDIIAKTFLAADTYGISTIVLGGGVTHSHTLRQRFTEKGAGKYTCVWPAPELSLDNAAMVAGLGYHCHTLRGAGDPFSLEPLTRISFTTSTQAMEGKIHG